LGRNSFGHTSASVDDYSNRKRAEKSFSKRIILVDKLSKEI